MIDNLIPWPGADFIFISDQKALLSGETIELQEVALGSKEPVSMDPPVFFTAEWTCVNIIGGHLSDGRRALLTQDEPGTAFCLCVGLHEAERWQSASDERGVNVTPRMQRIPPVSVC